jgi:hypothetical protein
MVAYLIGTCETSGALGRRSRVVTSSKVFPNFRTTRDLRFSTSRDDFLFQASYCFRFSACLQLDTLVTYPSLQSYARVNQLYPSRSLLIALTSANDTFCPSSLSPLDSPQLHPHSSAQYIPSHHHHPHPPTALAISEAAAHAPHHPYPTHLPAP